MGPGMIASAVLVAFVAVAVQRYVSPVTEPNQSMVLQSHIGYQEYVRKALRRCWSFIEDGVQEFKNWVYAGIFLLLFAIAYNRDEIVLRLNLQVYYSHVLRFAQASALRNESSEERVKCFAELNGRISLNPLNARR